jgi:hypothetical protein
MNHQSKPAVHVGKPADSDAPALKPAEAQLAAASLHILSFKDELWSAEGRYQVPPALEAATQELRARMADFADEAHRLVNGQFRKPEFVTSLQRLEEAAYAVAAETPDLSGQRLAHFVARNTSPRKHVSFGEEAFKRSSALEIAARALTLRLRLQGGKKPPKRASKNVHPMEVKRARERQGLRHRISVNVYDADLQLLRRFGLLAAEEMNNRDAIARALEVLLLADYLGRPGDSLPNFDDRLRDQRARLKYLAGEEDATATTSEEEQKGQSN